MRACLLRECVCVRQIGGRGGAFCLNRDSVRFFLKAHATSANGLTMRDKVVEFSLTKRVTSTLREYFKTTKLQ